MEEQIRETEITTGEVVSPQGAEITEEEVAQPHALDMNDADFDSYINGLKDGSGAENTAPPAEEHAEENKSEETSEETQPFRVFDTQEEFQNFMDKTVGERLRASKETEKRYVELENRAKSIYADDDNALEKMIEAAEIQKAEENGETAEDFRHRQQLEREAALYRASQKEQQDAESAILAKQREWEHDSEQLRQVIPDFDFLRAMENKDFAHSVINDGMSVAAAYIKFSAAEKKQTPSPRREVYEVGAAAGKGAGVGAVDPVNMNDADFSAYIHGIKDKG